MTQTSHIKWSTVAPLVLILCVFIVLYANTFVSLYHTWMTDEDYSHGFLIIPISLFLIWRKKDELINQSLTPSAWGYAFLCLWAVMYFLGYSGDISTFISYSIIFLLLAIVISLAGFRITGMVLFPILFLFFMIPIPSEIYTKMTNPMKLVATSLSVGVLNNFGVPIFQEGNIIHMPNYSMKVVVACSGIRSLISVMALSLLMGYVLFVSYIRRSVLFLLSLPVSIIGNIMRIAVTGVLAYYISTDMAEGFSHTMAGLLSFGLSLLLLLLSVFIIRWIVPEKE